VFIAMTLGFPASLNSFSATDEVPSPCIGVCTLAPSGMCIGCLRTSEEISMWLSYSADDRKLIVLELSRRLESLFAL
jgi:uncharacterized protein